MATCEKCGRDLDYFSRRGDTLVTELWYPPRPPLLGGPEPENPHDRPRFVEVSLCDVRAADDLRLSYDFDRDGWKIEQGQVFSWSSDDPKCGDPLWKEVAFIPAWGSQLCDDEMEHMARLGHTSPVNCPECTEEVEG